jgi:hypothetical protein
MTDVDTGAAPAAAESTSAPAEQVVQTPNPIRTDPPEVKAEAKPDEKEKAHVSARDAIKAAKEKVEAAEKTDTSKPIKADAKVDPKADPKIAEMKASNRDDNGRFKGKDADTQATQQTIQSDQQKPNSEAADRPKYEAPKRFSPDAVAEWERTPDAVKAEVHRAQRELEGGLEKYRASHDRYEQLRTYDETARSNGHDLKQSLDKVVAIEEAFARNPVEGFQRICDHFGLNVRQLAAHIAGMKPEDVQVQQEGTISELKRELASLKQQIGGVTQNIQNQQVAATSKEVEAFARDNPRFFDLQDDIKFFLTSEKVDKTLSPIERLSEAYKLADRLNPAPASTSKPAPAQEQTQDLTAQTRKGQKSISGAPSSGSDPAPRQASTSVKESLKRAFAQAG